MSNLSRKFLGATALAVASLSFAGNANAVPVLDAIHLAATNMKTMLDKASWVQQYTQMYTDYQNQISQIQNQVEELRRKAVGVTKLDIKEGYRDTKLSERAETAYLEETCGMDGGWQNLLSGLGSVSGSSTGPDRMKEVLARQRAACEELVIYENKRYNLVAKTVKSIQDRDKEIAELRKAAKDIAPDQPGLLQRNSNDIAKLQTQQENDREYAERYIQAYDAIIETMKNEIVRGGELAFTDKPNGAGGGGIIGSVTRYGTLKLALAAAKQRDR